MGSSQRMSDRVAEIIDEFGLLPDRRVAVACSGGKDSTYACLVLREIGFNVQPILVDMGYSPSWAERVGANLKSLGFSPISVSARSANVATSTGTSRPLLDVNLRIVSSQPRDPRFTPCTSCYNSKLLLILGQLEQGSFDRVVFGHHASDAVCSLLKSALMFIDRWDRGNSVYDPSRFRGLAVELRDSLLAADSRLLGRVTELVKSGKASTDEPPLQPMMSGVDRKIVRPLFGTWETEIIGLANGLGSLESSGCGHTFARDRQTPREIIQYEVVRQVESQSDIRDSLFALVRMSIADGGTLRVNSRKLRGKLLGESYKPAPGGVDKL